MMGSLLSLDDIVIIPEILSRIEHRSQCNVTDSEGKLPIFAAPMSCVIDMTNFEKFESSGIRTIIPRNIPIGTRFNQSINTFVAVSLDEFDNYIVNIPVFTVPHYICVDIANGHMKKLWELSKKAKEIHGKNLVLMVGNIANPKTYSEYAKIGVDYIRVGIGSGNVCTTSANTGIHYPMASLISGCYEEKIAHKFKTKIVADGGFKNFDQINKALAVGADYVMLGQILAKSEEACSNIVKGRDLNFDDIPFAEYDEDANYREYYGMSTKRAQKEFGKEGNTTAEGIVKWVKIEYPISKWIDNFKHYLRSAMSYTDSSTIEEYNGSKWASITPTGRMSYFK